MKFDEFEYKRIDINEIKEKIQKLIESFNKVGSFDEQCSIISKINTMRNDFKCMQGLAQLRKSLDIDKEFYCKEIDYYDEAEPILENLVSDFYRMLGTSKFEGSLRNIFGDRLFDLANMKNKCVSEKVLEELQKEKRLVTEYVSLCESIKTTYEGYEYGLWDFDSLICSHNRKTRKKAYETQTELYIKHEEEMQKLFDQFVKLRHEMALKMGYRNFIEMGYTRMNRIGYDKEMVENFRNQVLEYVVPLNTELIKRQGKRLGVAPIKYYDETVFFMDGNPKVKGNSKFVIDKIEKMYKELSNETDEFFKYITSRNLIDIEDRKNKEGGGFCEYMPRYKAPFIYTKYNGTIENFNEVVHEVGHAFQNYLCRNYDIPEYVMATEDIAEIHSMSMELLIEPWLEEFFGEGANKYKFSHMCSALFLLAYIAAVDEFQHVIYEKPEATYEERNNMWRDIEKKYIPYRNYEDNEYLEKGAYWLRQSHIFWGPFYYIDYGLAQVVAFDFWSKARSNREEAWKDYVNLCKAGGTLSLTEVLKVGNVRNIFKPGSIAGVVKDIEKWILDVEKKL